MAKTMHKHTLSQAEREKVIANLSDIMSKDKKILFAYLHGSFVAEDQFNDLDIAVYFTDMPASELLAYELKLEDIIETKLKIPIDLKSLNSAPVSFCYMVLKKGIKLIVNDDQRRVAFEMATYSQYFDFLPFRRRYLQEVLNADL